MSVASDTESILDIAIRSEGTNSNTIVKDGAVKILANNLSVYERQGANTLDIY